MKVGRATVMTGSQQHTTTTKIATSDARIYARAARGRVTNMKPVMLRKVGTSDSVCVRKSWEETGR